MLTISARSADRFCDRLSRRQLLQVGSIASCGLSLPGLLRCQAHADSSTQQSRIKSVVILYLSGGPSQLDMWDMKPDAPADIRGSFQPVDTRVPGIQISEHMPRMAQLADKYMIVRSMSHNEGDHIKGGYWVWTGARLERPIVQASGMKRADRPHIGSIVHKLLGPAGTMPPFVTVPEYVSPVGVPRPGQNAGFLSATHDPYLIHSDPNLAAYTPGELKPIPDVSAVRLGDRRLLLNTLETHSRHLEHTAVGRDLSPYYVKAFDLLSSRKAQTAFDVQSETPATRDRYGRHIFGQSALVARRLVEAGVRLVEVNFIRHDNSKGGQGYDSHSVPPSPPHLGWAKTELLPPTDNAFSALVGDLHDRGLLDETLVVMMGEFGRTPRFNQNGGRDHWPQCYSLILAGGGVPAGCTYGVSDKTTSSPLSDPVAPTQLLATIYHKLGIDPQQEIHDRQNRPYRIVDAQPITAWL